MKVLAVSSKRIAGDPDSWTVLVYVVFAVLSALVFATKLPPFMAPDEPNHFKRAEMITHGGLVGERFQYEVQPPGHQTIIMMNFTTGSGGSVDDLLDGAVQVFDPLKFNPSAHVTPAMATESSGFPWSRLSQLQPFSNTAVYPPIFYLPQSLGIALGKALGLSIVSTLIVSRLANALACLVVSVLALRVLPRRRLFLFCLLVLPMSSELQSVVTQDGLILAVSAVACAYMLRATSEGRPLTRTETLSAAVCLGLVGLTKPPYALLAFLLLFMRTEQPKWRPIAFASAFVPVVLWHLWMAVSVQTPLIRPDAVLDQGAQAAFVLHDPFAFPIVVLHTLRAHGAELVTQFVGDLGWLDTPLPKLYYAVAYFALGLSAVLGFRGLSRAGWGILGLLVASGLAVMLGLYVAYTPVGQATIDGVQGRYFLPLALFLPLAFGGREKESRAVAWSSWGVCVGLPLLSLGVVWRALSLRYFGG